MESASCRAWVTRSVAVASVALCVAMAAPLLAMRACVAHAATGGNQLASARPRAAHVVIVGISGLRWDLVSAAATPELWRLAVDGSVGSLVDYAQQPLACPADGWLTLNSAARAQGPRPCGKLPAVGRDGAGARIPAMPAIVRGNAGFHEAPDWGLLGSLARCATAVGPGAALALAAPDGTVSSYLPGVAQLSPAVLARCPLTVVDLGQIHGTERARATVIDRQLAVIAAELPPDTMLLITAPGAGAYRAGAGGGAEPPHLMTVVVDGPGYADGLLASSATRRAGIVVLTDLTPTVAGWLGRAVPAGTVGARIGRSGRSDLAATIRALRARDAAEQVWLTTHGRFLVGYAVADVVAFGLSALVFWGAAEERRRRRARAWRFAGAVAAAVPLGSYLANLVPWQRLAHPAWWLYGVAAGWTLALAAAALAGPWRRDPLGPFGVLALATAAVLGVDVMTGSRLQLDAPFGLSLLVSGRFYGIGNDALGIYCVSTLVGASWLASRLPSGAPRTARSSPASAQRSKIRSIELFIVSRGQVLVIGLAGLFAVVASGWPGFGAKVGGTIALVPCLLLLMAWQHGVRVGWRLAVPVAASGIALVAAFAIASYFFPSAGVSDMGTFAGNLLHGRGGDLLQRKVSSNVETLTQATLGWLVPVLTVLAAIALWRPAALRLRMLARAFEASPRVRVVAWLCWLVLLIGWLADDSGVMVPAVALPFAMPLAIAMAASVSAAAGGARYFGTAFAGTPVAGQPPR